MVKKNNEIVFYVLIFFCTKPYCSVFGQCNTTTNKLMEWVSVDKLFNIKTSIHFWSPYINWIWMTFAKVLKRVQICIAKFSLHADPVVVHNNGNISVKWNRTSTIRQRDRKREKTERQREETEKKTERETEERQTKNTKRDIRVLDREREQRARGKAN